MRLPFPSLLILALLLASCQISTPRLSAHAIPDRPVPDAALRETRWVTR